jgi:DNA primase large subunit
MSNLRVTGMRPQFYVSVLDPFSKEAEEIVRNSPPLDSLPGEICDRAVKRLTWRSGREMLVGSSKDEVQQEVLSFYLMCQGVASVSHPYSREVRFVSDATERTIKYRIFDLFRRGEEALCLEIVKNHLRLIKIEDDGRLGDFQIPKQDIFKLRDIRLAKDGVDLMDDRTLAQYIPRYAVRWADLSPLLKHGRAELTKLYIIKGWAVLTPRDLWDFFAGLISVRTEEYISSLYERFYSGKGAPQLFVGIGERISSLLPPEIEVERFAIKRGRLRPDFFPPCVKRCMAGVGAGVRNYAITVLLTSFLSYARISPSGKASLKISDFIDDTSIITDEIAPLIFDAAERCNPPLFKDQPQEKANVFYHLGFGMTVEPKLADSGKSRWYKVPNCNKIQISAPSLCDPDETCKKIKNPLTYYYLKLAGRAGG